MKLISILRMLLMMWSASPAQQSSMPWYSFSSGFAMTTAPEFQVKSSVAQMLIGQTRQGNTVAEYGFLCDTLLRGPVVGVQPEEGIPTVFQLDQNYPNPFNPSTMINYQLPMSNWVTLKVFDVLGREVATLVNEVKHPGMYTVQFDGSGLASGVYLYRLMAGEFQSIKKMIVLK